MRIIGYDQKDYQSMFALRDTELKQKIIEFNSGINSFNQELLQLGNPVVSCDPLYAQPVVAIEQMQQQTLQSLSQEFAHHPDKYVWTTYKDADTFMQHQQQIATKFFKDFSNGVQDKRYSAHTLLDYPTHSKKQAFDLVLLHNLFEADAPLSIDDVYHILNTALHLAPEVRLFPLLNEQGEHSPLLAPLLMVLQQHEYGVELRKVEFEWQKGGHVLLCVRAQVCVV